MLALAGLSCSSPGNMRQSTSSDKRCHVASDVLHRHIANDVYEIVDQARLGLLPRIALLLGLLGNLVKGAQFQAMWCATSSESGDGDQYERNDRARAADNTSDTTFCETLILFKVARYKDFYPIFGASPKTRKGSVKNRTFSRTYASAISKKWRE